MTSFKSILALGLTLTLVPTGLILARGDRPVQAPPRRANVFVYPHKLTKGDKVVFGTQKFEIKSETTLIWVDLQPDARFGHATELVLTTVEGTQVIKGNWWPTINGKAFRPSESEKQEVAFPLKVSAPVKANGHQDRANVFMYPRKLTIKDGAGITSEAILLWVDLAPDARFGHPTEEIWITTAGTRVVKGSFWPTINGKAFRPAEAEKYQVAFPMQVTGN
jgi:hypothetical protein